MFSLAIFSEKLAIAAGQAPDWNAARDQARNLTEIDALDASARSGGHLPLSLAELRQAGVMGQLRDAVVGVVNKLEQVWGGATDVYENQHAKRVSLPETNEEAILVSPTATLGDAPEDIDDILLFRLFGLAETAGFKPKVREDEDEDEEEDESGEDNRYDGEYDDGE